MSDSRTVREEWHSRTRYGKLFVPLLALGRGIDTAVFLLFCGGFILIFGLPVLFDKLLDVVAAWVSRRAPAVYEDDRAQMGAFKEPTLLIWLLVLGIVLWIVAKVVIAAL